MSYLRFDRGLKQYILLLCIMLTYHMRAGWKSIGCINMRLPHMNGAIQQTVLPQDLRTMDLGAKIHVG